jgi:hypothetical protein
VKNWTITEFIAYHYKYIKGNNIFSHCYNPLTGIWELLTPRVKSEEAKEVCKILKKDLIYYMSEANTMKGISDYKKITADMVDCIPWEPADIILGFEIIEVDENQENRGKKRHKNGSMSHKKKQVSYAAAARLATSNQQENTNLAPTTTRNFHPSPNGVITPHQTSHQEIQLEAQQTEILHLKE